MRYSVATGLVLAAFTVSDVVASPTHAHMHARHHHAKKDGVDYAKIDWDNLGIDWKSAWAAGQAKTTAPPPAPKTTAAAAPPPAPTTTTLPAAVFKEKTAPKVEEKPKEVTSANSISDDIQDLFDGVKGVSNGRTSFGEYWKIPGGSAVSGALEQGDNFHGNVGKPYGSNVMKVASKDGYDFTATFKNTQSKLITINVWNKGGSNNDNLSGASRAPKDTTLTFTLQAGQEQVVAFMEDSQIGWAESCKTNYWGAFDTTWGEANFVKAGSGFDVSAIPNSRGNTYDMWIKADEVECVSDMTQNFWLAAYTPIGGSDGSCYVPGSTMHLSVKMGGNVK